ncbi:MAG: hypothetical protein ACM32E_02120 [Gemmatimonadota bacterium]
MLFGCNEDQYSEVSADITGITMVRVTFGKDQIPNPWPATPAGTVGLAELKPPYPGLMSGALDAALTASLAAAPAGTWVCAYHEVNHVRPNQPYSAAQMRQIETHMSGLVRAANPALKYGVILNDASKGLASWVIPGLDFYAVDIYEGRVPGGVRDFSEVANRNFSQLPEGVRAIGETNSCTPAHRPAWFREAYDWLYTHNGGAMLTYWNPAGPYSGPWLHNDEATIYALRRISHAAGRGSL